MSVPLPEMLKLAAPLFSDARLTPATIGTGLVACHLQALRVEGDREQAPADGVDDVTRRDVTGICCRLE